MNYHSVIGPLSSTSGASPLTDAFSTGRFPSMEPMKSNDSLSQFESCELLQPIGQPTRMQAPQMQLQHQQQHSQSPFQPNQPPFTLPQPQFERSPSTSFSNNNGNILKPRKRGLWALTGRLFEKRKSVSENSNIPNIQNETTITRKTSGNSTPENGSATINSSSNSSGSRRSSLADIPKALLSSLRRASLISSSESKENLNQTQYRCNPSETLADKDTNTDQASIADETRCDDENETIPTTTIMAMDGPCQATLIPSKEPPTSDSDLSHAKNILKKPSSITDGSMVPTSNEGANPPSSLILTDNIHPLALTNETMDDNLISPSDHRAQLVALSPVSNPHSHQQQNQEQELYLYPLLGTINSSTTHDSELTTPLALKSAILELESHASQGAAIPPESTPGVQSNVYHNRGSERSQGMAMDPHMGEGVFMSFTQTHRQYPQHHYDPFAMSGFISPRVQEVSNEYFSTSEPSLSMHQRNSISSESSDDSFYEPSAVIMDEPHRNSIDRDISMPMLREGYGYSQFNHSPPAGPRSSTDSGSEGGRRKSISFTDAVEIIPMHCKSEYNRRSDRNATFRVLTPGLKAVIREELNDYKMREMAVHVRSMGNTTFH
ncbi:hypothetical protein BGX27_005370 [Mortierella sp. AM989]|nr:hypothetical protein BGX27_005370 [Mortierella sp. AM989]